MRARKLFATEKGLKKDFSYPNVRWKNFSPSAFAIDYFKQLKFQTSNRISMHNKTMPANSKTVYTVES